EFLTAVKGFSFDGKRVECSPHYKLEIMTDVINLLHATKIPVEDMLYAIYRAKKEKNDEACTLSELLREYGYSFKLRNYQIPQDELMRLGYYYYHPVLQITPGLKPRVVDFDFFDRKEEEEVFYLEMRDSFSKQDLYLYFRNKIRTNLPEQFEKREMGSIDYLCQLYDLDTIIYMVDAYIEDRNQSGTSKPAMIIQVQDFYDTASTLLENRKNILYEGGIDYVRLKPDARIRAAKERAGFTHE
ncbi:MAG: hypothetical protein ACRC5C_00235, partial [Bacilli bacterium]